MREIKATNNGSIILVDDEDYERLVIYNWFHHDKNVRRKNKIHREGRPSKFVNIPIANEVMQKFDCLFDHKDREGLNNQKDNLREATYEQNACNKTKFANRSSIYKGVFWNKTNRNWNVTIGVNKRRIYLGRFDSEEMAALAYNKAATKYFGEFACLNVIPDKTNNKVEQLA